MFSLYYFFIILFFHYIISYFILFLGVSPLLTVGLISSFLSSTQYFDFLIEKNSKTSPEEIKKKKEKIQKLFAFFLCLFQSVAYVLAGMYGTVDVLGTGNATMIVLQARTYTADIFFSLSIILFIC